MERKKYHISKIGEAREEHPKTQIAHTLILDTRASVRTTLYHDDIRTDLR